MKSGILTKCLSKHTEIWAQLTAHPQPFLHDFEKSHRPRASKLFKNLLTVLNACFPLDPISPAYLWRSRLYPLCFSFPSVRQRRYSLTLWQGKEDKWTMTGNTLHNSTGSQVTEEVLHIIFISTISILIYLYAYCPRWLGKFKSKEKKCNMVELNEQPWIPCEIRGWCSSWKVTCCPSQSAFPMLTAGIVGKALPQLPCGERL